MQRVCILVAPKNFRDLEYLVPKAIWEQKGYEVETVSTTQHSVGRFGYKTSNSLLSDVSSTNYDACFMVGGLGALVFMPNNEAKGLVEAFIKQNKPVGAICAAPRNLLAWGLLKGMKATGHNWDGVFPTLCKESGAKYSDKEVVVDNKILTANGPEAAEEAANKFLDLIEGK